MRVRAGSGAVSGRDVFASTADAELWVVDRDDPLLDRADPYARRVFRDSHPLDNDPTRRFDDGNGQRITARQHGREGDRRGQHRAAAAGAHLRHADARTRWAGSTTRSRSTASRSSAAAFDRRGRPVEEQPAASRPTGRRRSRSPPTTWRTCTTTATTRSTAATSPATPAARASPRRSTTCPAQRGGLPRAAGRARRPDRHRPARTGPDPGAGGRGPGHLHGLRRRAGLRRHQQRRRQARTPSRSWRWRSRRPAGRRTPPRTTGPARTPAASPRRSCTAPTGCRWPAATAADPCWARRRPCQYRAAGLPLQRRRAEPEGPQRGAAGGCGHARPAWTGATSSPALRRWASSPWPRRPARPSGCTLWALSNHYSSGPDSPGRAAAGAGRVTARRSSPRSRRPTRPPGWSTAGT